MITDVNESLENYAFHRASAIINHNENNKSIGRDREIGRVFAEYKDELGNREGKNKKEHEYLIPKTKIHRYGDKRVYFNLPEESLKEFEI